MLGIDREQDKLSGLPLPGLGWAGLGWVVGCGETQ